MSTSRFLTPDPSLALGSTHAGFSVTGIEALPELSGTGYVMRHNATGARLLWIAVDDTNKSFAISFKTPPADDTGVFHIIEHSVLCGSEKFPVKEPFVNLIKSSMQTFLNALTFPDKTMYPVASTNTADLENLMDVYLDAVLHPAIYSRPRIFEQEGWHYELEDLDAPLTYNGVVFNEMKGALSDPDDVAFQELNRLLFPHTAYGFESGGNPRAIPSLTYENFLDAHARHYQLSNSYTILYGDIDIERELAFINERFSAAEDRVVGAPNPLRVQEAVAPALQRKEMATAPENASVTVAYVTGTAESREHALAVEILADVLAGSNEAPLKRAVLDAGLGDDFVVRYIDSELQPQLMFILKGAHEGVAEEFIALVEKTCARLADTGLERERVSAALSQAEFNLREGDWGGYPDGVALSMLAMASWLYDDARPVDYLRYQDAINTMRAGMDTGYFEALLRELVCESTHHAAVELVPVAEGDAAEEAAELANCKAQMSTEELEEVISEVAALREEQERKDSPEALATLPHLSLADIAEAPKDPVASQPEAPLTCWAYELNTHRIDYVYHYFDLRRLRFEELPYASILSSLLGRLDTERMSAAKLDTVVEENLGSLDFFCEVHSSESNPDYVLPLMTVGSSALSEKIDKLAALPSEVWTNTKFDNLEQIYDILQQRRIALEQSFVGSGHAAALARLSSYFSKAALVHDAIGGVSFYLFLKELLANWSERAQELPATLAALCKRIFTSDEAIVSFVGSSQDRNRFWELGGSLGLAPAEGEGAAHRLNVPEPEPKNEAFIVPANVCFVAAGQPARAADTGNNGLWSVAGRILSYDYLWNEVRVKGGAYGSGFRHLPSGCIQYYSYRDPAVDPTLARYEQAGAWLAQWSPSPQEMSDYIISVVATHDAPVKAHRLARRQDALRFALRPHNWRETLRRQMLDSNSEAIRTLASALSTLADARAICVFGGAEQIASSSLELEVAELMGAE